MGLAEEHDYEGVASRVRKGNASMPRSDKNGPRSENPVPKLECIVEPY